MDTAEQPADDRRLRVALAIAVTCLLLLPAIVTMIRYTGRDWLAVDDFGITALRVRDVFTTHTPLTGLYSRPGWNHPGPLMFWGMALISAPTGYAPWAVHVSGAVLQAVALGWLAFVTWRAGLAVFLAAAATTALTFLAVGSWLFTQPWNPNIPVCWFVLFLFLTLIAAQDRFRQLIAMSIAGNVMLQTHISYTAFVVVAFVWVVGCALRDARRTGRAPEGWRSTVAICGAIWVAVWALPIWGWITGEPGGLGRILDYFLDEHRSVGIRSGVRIMADEFRWAPNWLGASTRTAPITEYALPASLLWLVVPVVLLTLAYVASRRTHSSESARRVAFATIVLVVGIVAISNADEPRAYTFRWRAVVAAFVVVVAVWSLLPSAARHLPKVAPTIGIACMLVLVGWASIGLGVSVADETTYQGLEQRGPVLERLMSQLRREGLPRDRRVLVQFEGDDLPSLFDGLVDQLDRAGVDVRVDPELARVFGEQRVGWPRHVDERWLVVDGNVFVARAANRPGARVLAATSPLTRAEQAELDRLQLHVAAQLIALARPQDVGRLDSALGAYGLSSLPRVDRVALTRIAALDRKIEQSGSCRCAVVSLERPGANH